MTETLWLARDADGHANLYTLLTARPVLRSDGMATTAEESAECLGAFPPDVIEPLLGVRLQPGQCVSGTLTFNPDGASQEMPEQAAHETPPSRS